MENSAKALVRPYGDTIVSENQTVLKAILQENCSENNVFVRDCDPDVVLPLPLSSIQIFYNMLAGVIGDISIALVRMSKATQNITSSSSRIQWYTNIYT